MPHFKAEDIHGVKVFTLPEVIISLITRDQKEAREKDQKAFSYLIRKKGELLNAEDKERIVGILRQKFNMPSLVWDDVVKQAQDIKAQFKAEKKQTTPTQPTQNRLQIPTAEELFKQRRQQKLASLPRRPGKGV